MYQFAPNCKLFLAVVRFSFNNINCIQKLLSSVMQPPAYARLMGDAVHFVFKMLSVSSKLRNRYVIYKYTTRRHHGGVS